MENINQHLIRISGKGYIEKSIEFDRDVEVIIKEAVVKIETLNNQDGTFDRVYVLKPIEVEVK